MDGAKTLGSRFRHGPCLGPVSRSSKNVAFGRQAGGVRTRVMDRDAVLESTPKVIEALRSPSFPGRIQPPEFKTYERKDDVLEDEEVGLGAMWKNLSARDKTIAATSLSFIICSMDKVNMSVAIIPIAHHFGWTASISGLVQSAFFYGYMLCQIPGGFLSSKISGSRALPLGVGTWSLATMAVPLLGGNLLGLCGSRALVGLGEALSPASATDIVARAVPKEDRSKAISFIFSGYNMGTILGLLAAPVLIEQFGWESVFYTFGAVGLVWVLFFEGFMSELRESEPDFAMALTGETSKTGANSRKWEEKVPWRAMLRNRPLQALMVTHFCNNWFHFTMLAWLPTYFADTMKLDLTGASYLTLIPPIVGIMFASIAGTSADYLISQGWPVTTVRKLAQSIAFLGPMVCLSCAALSDDGLTDVICIAAALGLGNFSLAGLYSNHQDLSPKYASVLLGITNTVGAFPGIAGVAAAGWLLDQTGSWSLSLMLPSVLLFASGTVVYGMFGTGEPQVFEDNRPFWIESKFEEAQKRGFAASVGQFFGR